MVASQVSAACAAAFRDLERKDAPKVAALTYQLTRNIIDPDNLTQRIADSANAQNSQWMVAVLDGEVVGSGGLCWYTIPSKGLIAWIEEIVVDDNERGRHIGLGLMEALIRLAIGMRVNMLKLTTGTEEARHLYEKLGFEKKEKEDYYTLRLAPPAS